MNENKISPIYPTIEMSNIEAKEVESFNRRKGEMSAKFKMLEDELKTYSQKTKRFSAIIKSFDWFDIITASVVSLASACLGFIILLTPTSPIILGSIIGGMCIFEIIKKVGVTTAVKLWIKKSKTKYAKLKDLATRYRYTTFLSNEKILDDGKITVEELDSVVKLYNEYVALKEQIVNSGEFTDEEKNEIKNANSVSNIYATVENVVKK